MLRVLPRPHAAALPFFSRLYSTPTAKSNIKLVAELRKRTEVSLAKAKEALGATNNDIDAALEWLQNDMVASGAKKAAKLADREAKEGLITVSMLSNGSGRTGGVRAAMVELNCETDFVARNELFGQLARDIAHTAAFIGDDLPSGSFFRNWNVEELYDAPIVPANQTSATSGVATVRSSIQDTLLKLGERIQLRRAAVVIQDSLMTKSPNLALRLASYLHGTTGNTTQGRIGTLALLALKSPQLAQVLKSEPFQEDLGKLERSLVRQITGFDTRSIRSPEGLKDECALYEQPFMMYPGELSSQPVRQVLDTWAQENGLVNSDDGEGGVEVLEFAKWAVGEPIEV